jgi:hypothetical protein
MVWWQLKVFGWVGSLYCLHFVIGFTKGPLTIYQTNVFIFLPPELIFCSVMRRMKILNESLEVRKINGNAK